MPIVFAQAQAPNPYAPIILAVVLLGFYYVLVIRPQGQQAKKKTVFLAGLQKGDDIVTSVGIIGKIVSIDGNVATIESAGTKLKLIKTAIEAKWELGKGPSETQGSDKAA